jgi:dTDP-4-dehydrorhamnose 3,5-epimerase-like enzyme
VSSLIENEPVVVELAQHSDDGRGFSFSLPAVCREQLGRIGDMHLASIEPGHVRGDHFHVERREVLVVFPHDAWSLHWDGGEGTPAAHRDFTDVAAIAVIISPHTAHAIRNDGTHAMTMISMTDGEYDPDRPDAYRRVVSRSSG